jgi:hypothetical protein
MKNIFNPKSMQISSRHHNSPKGDKLNKNTRKTETSHCQSRERVILCEERAREGKFFNFNFVDIRLREFVGSTF